MTIGQIEVRLAGAAEENTRQHEAARQAQEQAITARSVRDQLSFQLQEATSTRNAFTKQLNAAQETMNITRTALAGREKEAQLLAERLVQTEQKMEKLEQERVALLTDRAELQALAAKRTEKEKKGGG